MEQNLKSEAPSVFPFPGSPVPPNPTPLFLSLNGYFDLREGQHIKLYPWVRVKKQKTNRKLWASCLGSVTKKKTLILALCVGALG